MTDWNLTTFQGVYATEVDDVKLSVYFKRTKDVYLIELWLPDVRNILLRPHTIEVAVDGSTTEYRRTNPQHRNSYDAAVAELRKYRSAFEKLSEQNPRLDDDPLFKLMLGD